MNEATSKLPQSIAELKAKDIARFWAKVKKGQSNDCWNWQASTDDFGYGKLAFGKLLMGAHRLSYLIEHKTLVGGVVMHSCDNPRCVNPAHLSLGNHALNAADKAKKARSAWGTKHPSCKLSEADVITIRRRRKNGERLRIIAADHSLTTGMVHGICSGRYWKHLS